MKALSVHQPWAYLLVQGAKVFETRKWQTKYRGPLLIHASRTDTTTGAIATEVKEVAERYLGKLGFKIPDKLALGAIIGEVWLIECRSTNDFSVPHVEGLLGDFSRDRHAWCMATPLMYTVPIPCRGLPGIWEVQDAAILTAVQEQHALAIMAKTMRDRHGLVNEIPAEERRGPIKGKRNGEFLPI